MSTETSPSDIELLQAMLAGDEEALAALYRRRARDVHRFALHMCGSQSLAEDVTQEVFMVLMREGHTFDRDKGSLPAFLIGAGLKRPAKFTPTLRVETPKKEWHHEKTIRRTTCRGVECSIHTQHDAIISAAENEAGA